MEDRFNEFNLSLLKALEALVPKSNLFLDVPTLNPFLVHYSISETVIVSEVPVIKNFLGKHDPDLLSFHQLSKASECFPTTLQCYQIAMTMGVSSATTERSFSSLQRIKTYLRSTMTQERFANLALLYIERDLSSQLWDKIDELVIRYAQTHNNK